MNSSVRVVQPQPQVPFLVRVLWFVFVGWYLMFFWIIIAWVLNISIVGLPLGVWMLNRAPLVLTLRAPRQYSVAQVQGNRIVDVHYQNVEQHPWPLRLLYFLLIGWWLSLAWSIAGWLLCLSIIGLPVGLLMLNRLPEVTTLMRQ